MVNQILHHDKILPIDFVDQTPFIISTNDDIKRISYKYWTSIIVKEGLFESKRKELILNDYPLIQYIHIQRDSSKGFTSLTISNLPKLTILTAEDEAFRLTKSFTLSSIF